ncbi:MAG TPA: glycosyltransferase family 39 protein, partial [Candidatus Eremiobacteraceae bacterium]|nr:glycosyltransferase family 39 protein [Candidatus Eremiobacteraceae bacterium]
MFVGITVFAHLCITLPLAWILNTWIDEAYTLNTTGKTVGYAIHQAIHFELQPPLYFALLTLWREIDHSVFFARLFSVICAAAMVYCVAPLAARYIRTANPMVAVMAVAFNPAAIWAAEEIRVYAFSGLLSALLLWMFYDGYLAERRFARVLYAALAVTALYTQYFLGFLLLGAGIALIVTRRFQALREYLLTMVPVAVAAIPIAVILRSQISQGTAVFVNTKSLTDLVYSLYSILLHFALPLGIRHIVPLGIVLLVATLVLAAPSTLRVERMALWVISIVSAVCIVAIVFVTREPSFGQRYVFIFFIPFILAIVAQLASARRAQQFVLVGWLIVMLAGSAMSLFRAYGPMAKAGDWHRVADYIMASERPGQPILAFQSENAVNLMVYYSGANKILAVPNPINFNNVGDTDV